MGTRAVDDLSDHGLACGVDDGYRVPRGCLGPLVGDIDLPAVGCRKDLDGARPDLDLGDHLAARGVDDGRAVLVPKRHVAAASVRREGDLYRPFADWDTRDFGQVGHVHDGHGPVAGIGDMDRPAVGAHAQAVRQRADCDTLHHLPGCEVDDRDGVVAAVRDECTGAWLVDMPPHLSPTGKRTRLTFPTKSEGIAEAKRLLRELQLDGAR